MAGVILVSDPATGTLQTWAVAGTTLDEDLEARCGRSQRSEVPAR